MKIRTNIFFLFRQAKKETENEKYAESNRLLDRCIEFSQLETESINIAVFHVYRARNFIKMRNLNKALEELFLSEQILIDLRKNQYLHVENVEKNLSLCYFEKAKVYYWLGEYLKALINSNVSLKIAKRLKLVLEVPKILMHMGICYYSRGWILKALGKYQKAKSLLEKEENDQKLLECLLNLMEMNRKMINLKECKSLIKQAIYLASPSKNAIGYAQLRKKIADYFLAINDLNTALKNYDISLEIFRQRELQLDYTRCLSNKGYALYKFKKNELAFQIFKKVERILVDLKDGELKVANFINLGIIFQRFKKYDQAESYFLKAFDYAKQNNILGHLDNSIFNLIGIKYWKNDLDGAILLMEKFIQDAEKNENKILEGMLYLNLGKIFRWRGDYDLALKHFIQSKDIFNSLAYKIYELKVISQIGIIHKIKGDFENMISLFKSVREILGSSKSNQLTIYLLEIGRAYFELNKMNKALSYFNQSLRMSRRMGDWLHELVSLSFIGQIYLKDGFLDNALKLFNRLYKKSEMLGSIEGIQDAVTHKGIIKLKNNEYDEAYHLFKEAVSLSIELKDLHSYIIISRYIGECYMKQEQYLKALAKFRIALKASKQFFFRKDTRLSLTDLGCLYGKMHKISKAEALFQQAEKLFNDSVFLIKSEELRNLYRSSEKMPHEFLLDLYLTEYKKTNNKNTLMKLLIYLEDIRSKEILNSLIYIKLNKNVVEKEGETENLERKRKKRINYLEEELDKKQKQAIACAYRIEERKIDNFETSILKEKFNEFLIEINDYIEEIREKTYSPGIIYTHEKNENLINEIESIIKNHNIIIWYMIVIEKNQKEQKFFYILRWLNDAMDLIKIKILHKNEILKLLEDLHHTESSELPSYFHQYIKNLKLNELKCMLKKSLPNMLFEDLNSFNMLIIIPHDYLFSIPWEILDEISLRIPVVQDLSLNLFSYLLKKNTNYDENKFLFFFNPNYNIPNKNLLYDEKKKQLIKYYFKDIPVELTIREQETATKSEFKDLINKMKFNLIHFSGHAQYDIFNINPKITGISFYDKDTMDIMNLHELSQLELKDFPLVLIDACESSKGISSKINEPISIIKSLHVAGAGTILATNWSLEDRFSYHFSNIFYTYLINGYNIGISLFKTRIDLRSMYPERSIWGNFTLYGNPFIKFRVE